MSPKAPLIPSATSVLLNPTKAGFEVLLLKRNSKIQTHGGSWVFPGGKCDIADCNSYDELTNFEHLTKERQLEIAKQAALREAFEEASIRPSTSLALCSNWITPPTMPKRFNAFFFIGEHNSRDVEVDQQEICDYLWLAPETALAKHESSELTLPPPTFVTLLQLSKYSDINIAIQTLAKKPMTYRPKLIKTGKGFHSVYEEDAGYEEELLEINNPVHRLVVDSGKFEYLSGY